MRTQTAGRGPRRRCRPEPGSLLRDTRPAGIQTASGMQTASGSGTRVTASTDTRPSRTSPYSPWSEQPRIPVRFHPSPVASEAPALPRQRPPFAQNTVDIYSILPYSMDFRSTPPVTPVKQPRRRDPKQTTFEFRPDWPRRCTARHGSSPQVPLPDAAPHPRTHSRVLSGADHPARPRRRPRAPDRGGGRQGRDWRTA